MSIEQELTSLTTAVNSLTTEVTGKTAEINTTLSDKTNWVSEQWVAKEDVIDVQIAAKLAEIDARIANFDTQTFYVAPVALGSGNGLTPETATTLTDLVGNHLNNALINQIKLAPGQHVLPGAIGAELSNYLLIFFEHDDSYGPFDKENVNTHPVICTEHTVDADISESLVADPNPSQTCQAHSHDEIPLIFHNCGFKFQNVYLRGTRGCLKADEGSVWFTSFQDILNTKTWVYNISCTSHTGYGIWLNDCSVVGLGNDIESSIFHPDYTQCGDEIQEFVSPIVISGKTRGIQRGQIIVNGNNIVTGEYPTKLSEGFRTDVATSSPSAITVIGESASFEIDRLVANGLRQLFYVTGQLKVNYIGLVGGSQPVQWLGQVHGPGSRLILTDNAGAWPADSAPEALKIENINTDPDHASLIVYDGGEFHANGMVLTTTECACGTLITTNDSSEVSLKNVVVTAPDRTGNQGFMQILNTANTRTTLKDCSLETRAGNNDTAIITTEVGKTISKGNTFTTSTEHLEATYGRYLDNNGIVSGGTTITQNTILSVPSEYATIHQARDFLQDKIWAADVEVVIEVDDGVYDVHSTYELYSNYPFILRGKTVHEKNVRGFVSAAGSAGDWDIQMTLEDVDDLAVGLYANVFSLVGTGDPEAAGGCLEITNIVGNTVTLKSTHRGSTFPTLTLTSGRFRVPMTRFICKREHISIFAGYEMISFQDIICVQSSAYGMAFHNPKQLKNVGANGIFAFTIFYTGTHAEIKEGVCVSNGNQGIIVYDGVRLIVAADVAITGNYFGVSSLGNSSLLLATGIVGNVIDYRVGSGYITAPNLVDRVYSPAYGVLSVYGGIIAYHV